MRIKKMTATFGKLDGAVLELREGLNILTAPNEAGKSTWCAFLRAMLYGIPTRERDTRTALAEKNRYAPWSGAPMAGEIELTWRGQDITLRRFAKGASPFGGFEAVYTGTGEAVSGLTAENCGEVLLGVGRETFQRTAFVGQSGVPIDADPDLEKRIAALVSSGEEVRLYACGGDGTLNEVVNGAAGFDNAAVTCVPKGTGNDFLKLFGPRFRELFNDLEALAAGPQRAFDLMDCNGKLGLDVVCAGVDARIAAGVHRYKDLRFVSGIGAYLLSLTEQVIFRGLCRPLTIRADGLDWQERQTAILCICNGRHYGGGFMPVPDAMPDDGVLDVLAVGEISRLTFFRLVGKYAQGLYRQYPQFITDWHGQSLSFSSPREITVVVDGEVMRGTRFTVRLSPLKINFFFPAGADYSPEF